MRTFSTIFISILIMAGLSSCLSQQKMVDPMTSVTKLSGSTGLTDGSLVYSLPMTVFTVKVEIERLKEVPGPYSKYAGEMLGLSKVILAEDEFWSVRGITISNQSEIDPSEYYIIESNSMFQSNALALKREGLILDLNPSLMQIERNQYADQQSDTRLHSTFDLGAASYFQVQRDTAYRRVAVDSSFVRIPYLVEKKRRLSVDQLADMAAKRLMELREGKFLILTGESNVFPQNKAAIDELNRMEKEYTELFSGKTWTESKTITFQFIPKKEMAGKQVEIFRYSEKTGPLSVTDKTGIPVMIELVPEQKTKDLTVIKKPQEEIETNYDKMFYRVPDVVNMKISSENETLYQSRQLIYQFGNIVQLPANFIIGK
jgi:hypothetical protein